MTHDDRGNAAGRVVRVRTDVAAVAKTFDYAVPADWRHDVLVGTRVRAPFHGRTVRGWVVDEEVGTPAAVDVLPLKSWLGWGPPPALVELAEWAGWRWAGPASFFLRIASPATIVRGLPMAPPPPAPDAAAPQRADLDLAETGVTVVRQPPLTDPLALVLSVVGDDAVRARHGSVLVLVPSAGWAERLTSRLERRGWPTARTWEQARAGWPVVVGSRAGAWAPVPRLAAVVVLDAHDAAYREESAPTYSAVDVLIERTSREGVPCVLASPVPPLALAARAHLRNWSIVAVRIPAAACSRRSSSAWPGRPSTRQRLVGAVLSSACTTARAGLAYWPAATAASSPVVPAVAPPSRSRGAKSFCAARVATRPARSCVRRVAGCG